MKKISTITPCYKMGSYIKKFLEELPKQTCLDDLQVVLDHNEPTEEELDLVSDFSKAYPGVVKHMITVPVVPIGVSMNKCIDSADGEHLAIWNVDDLRTPYSLEYQSKILDLNPTCDIANGNFVITREFGATHGQFVDHSIYEPGSKEFTRSMVLGPFFMFRKALLSKAGKFDEQLKSGADFDLAIRLAANNSNVICAPGLLGYYLNEGKGASTNGDGRQPTERTVIELRYGIYDKIENMWVEKASSYNIQNILHNGDWLPVSTLIPNFNEFKQQNRFAK